MDITILLRLSCINQKEKEKEKEKEKKEEEVIL